MRMMKVHTEGMNLGRVRLGVSLDDPTVELLDLLVAEGRARNRSDAICELARAWQRWEADADLVAAARDVDPAEELAADWILGADPTGEDPGGSPSWSVAD